MNTLEDTGLLSFEDLTPAQQRKAVEKQTETLLHGILEGVYRFNDELNGDDLQARIDAAIEKAEQMQTPWFAHEYIMDSCRDEIEGMAQSSAELALYATAETPEITHGIT